MAICCDWRILALIAASECGFAGADCCDGGVLRQCSVRGDETPRIEKIQTPLRRPKDRLRSSRMTIRCGLPRKRRTTNAISDKRRTNGWLFVSSRRWISGCRYGEQWGWQRMREQGVAMRTLPLPSAALKQRPRTRI
jgi:hypothetical protein